MRQLHQPFPALSAKTALLLAVALLVAGPADAGIREALGNSPNLGTVIRLLETSPVRCTQGTQRRVCTWLIAEASPARSQLASKLAGPGPLQVVCDFSAIRTTYPVHGSTCSVHEPAMPRNRRRRQPPTLADPEEAALALKQARTFVQLSHTFASSPTDCVQRNEAEWICAWVAQPREPGHALLGALAETLGAARLVCRLPIETGDRKEDSCRAQEMD